MEANFFNGDIAYARKLSKLSLLKIGLSFGFSNIEEDEEITDPILNEGERSYDWNIGISCDFIYYPILKTFSPFIGFGLSGGYGNNDTETITGKYSEKTYSLTTGLPFGLEFKIIDNFKIGILSNLYFHYINTSEITTIIETNSKRTILRDSYSVNFSNPKIYLSLWF